MMHAAAPAQSIANFTRVSKSAAFLDSPVKKLAGVAPTTTVQPAISRKRKAENYEVDSSPIARRNTSFSPSSDEDEAIAIAPLKRACRRAEPLAVPVAKSTLVVTKGKKMAKAAPSRMQTAHRVSSSTFLSKAKQGDNKVQTKIDVIVRKHASTKDQVNSDLPPHLADLLRLHKAFLETVKFNFAHGGSNSPIDFRAIGPHISRNWGKRQVTVEDIRRCVAIQSSSRQEITSPFIITDYGRGKVCIELNPAHDAVAINEDRLCKQFEDNLRDLCAERAVDDMADVDVPLESLSLAELPKADITNMDLGIKANPQLAKGQRVLTELKNDLVTKRQEKEVKQVIANKNPLLNPDGTKMSLLDRLRLKQLAKADAPLPPTGPEIQRRAALNRVSDVSATISMLSLANPLSLPRQAFAMTVIADKLKDSLRVPMSREEAIACVRIISSEVAPEWLRIVTIGGRDNVVVQRQSQPVDRVINERVQRLLA